MPPFPPTIILRHRRENLKKCTLRGLEERPDCRFFTYPQEPLPELSHYLLLSFEGPPLGEKDNSSGLFLIDATWRYAETIYRQLPALHSLQQRSLPTLFQTAYPRRQNDCREPGRGLASIEALFIAYLLMGRSTEGLLDNYFWKAPFTRKNNLLDFLGESL
jgi:pre-rRNA-processing protein TSR3